MERLLMKRTALRRKAPLLQRQPMARKRRKAPSLDPEERRHVLNRDGECIIPKLVRLRRISSLQTPCRDQYGQLIVGWRFENLTYEHVKPAAGMAIKAPDAPGVGRRWAVAACHHHNAVDHAVSRERPAIRAYLEELAEQGRL